MNIYRHKENKKLYTIEHLIRDIRHLNNNAFAGIYGYPYNWKSDIIIFQNKNHEDCKNFVDKNFNKVAIS
jgi:hypothetical protein